MAEELSLFRRINNKISLTKLFRSYKEKKKKADEIKEVIFKISGRRINKFKQKIYVIGDSHTNFFGGEEFINFLPLKNPIGEINTGKDLIPFFKTFHLGPALAYNLSKYFSSSQALEKTEYLIKQKIIPQKSTLLLCYGEIDCRTQIVKQAERQSKSYSEIIDGILENYFEYINYLKSKGFKVICWGPIASQKDGWYSNTDYPTYGNELQRNEATKIFNEKLEQKCQENQVIYCSIFNKLIDKDLRTQEKYISDLCHLSQKALDLVLAELIDKDVISF